MSDEHREGIEYLRRKAEALGLPFEHFTLDPDEAPPVRNPVGDLASLIAKHKLVFGGSGEGKMQRLTAPEEGEGEAKEPGGGGE